MLYSLRTRIGQFFLRRESSSLDRNQAMINLAGARNIGILYPLFNLADHDEVERFVTELQKDHKEVRAMGYLPHKELVSRFHPRLSYDYFSQQELNWYLKPSSPKVEDFIRTEFDLLIDLSITAYFPIAFIVALSRARCKVGRFDEGKDHAYDLMIKAGEDLPLPEFISQIKHYLTVIKQHD